MSFLLGEAGEREGERVVATMSRGQLAFGLAWHVLSCPGLDWPGLVWTGISKRRRL